MSVPYLKWGEGRCTYILLRCNGLSQKESLPLIPNGQTGELGVSKSLVDSWMQEPEYAEFLDMCLDDPMHYHRDIYLPSIILKIDQADMDYLRSPQSKEKGFSSKARELIYQQAGLLEQRDSTGNEWTKHVEAFGKFLIRQEKKRPKALPETKDADVIELDPITDEHPSYSERSEENV